MSKLTTSSDVGAFLASANGAVQLQQVENISLNNGSSLRKGSSDAGLGGYAGIAQFCSIGYELKWEAGRLYSIDQSGYIRVEQYAFYPPTAADDITKKYLVGSYRILDNGTTYICTDNTEAAAVWNLISLDYAANTAEINRWRESDYIRPSYQINQMINKNIGDRSFVFGSGTTMNESDSIGIGDSMVDIPDGITALYDTNPTSPIAWTALNNYSGVSYLPASLEYVTFNYSDYAGGAGTFSEDKIVTFIRDWMDTQPGFFKTRTNGSTRTIDASLSSYGYSNSIFDSSFLSVYNALIAAGWVIYLPNNNIPLIDPGAWSENEWIDTMNSYVYVRGNASYTYCSDPNTIYVITSGDNVEIDNYLFAVDVSTASSFPNYTTFTFTPDGGVNNLDLSICKAGGNYYISP